MSKPVARWMWLMGLLCLPAETAAQSRTFDIYWVDVEGGAATLLVSPPGNRCSSILATLQRMTGTRSESLRRLERPA